MPATNAVSERSASALKQVETYLLPEAFKSFDDPTYSQRNVGQVSS